jgi:hypothetical protein
MVVSGKSHAPAALLPGNKFGTRCTGGWVGQEVGLDGYEKSLHQRNLIPGPSSQ